MFEHEGGAFVVSEPVPERLLLTTTAVFAAVGLLSATIGVVNRLWIGGAIHGVDEIARFSLAWFTALSVGVASAAGLHYRLGVGVSSLLPKRMQRTTNLIQRLAADVLVGGIILWAAIEWLPTAALRTSLILNVSLAVPHAAIAVMGVLLIVMGIRHFVAEWGDRVKVEVDQR